GGSGRADLGVPSPARDRLRGARVGMCAGSRVGGVRVAGLQVSALALRPHVRRMTVAWAIALALGAGAVALGQTAWIRLPHPRPLEELSYYPSGRHLKAATLGHAESAADLAWLRAVQYYGAHR